MTEGYVTDDRVTEGYVTDDRVTEGYVTDGGPPRLVIPPAAEAIRDLMWNGRE